MAIQKHVVVIGAGVTGLQTSISLLEAGYRVTIVAKYFPGDKAPEYTSNWAGAQWRTHASAEDVEQQAWDVDSYNYWLSIIARELNEPNTPKSGLGMYESRYFTAIEEGAWFSNLVLNFRLIPLLALPEGIIEGHTYFSIMVNTPMYLQYLLDTAKSLGVTTIRETLPISKSLASTLRGATEIVNEHYIRNPPYSEAGSPELPPSQIDAWVNATGLGAKDLVPDEAMYPIRGQTVTVKGEAKGITTLSPATPASGFGPSEPTVLYILPRPHSGTSVIGGTKQAGNWNLTPDPITTVQMLENAKQFAPELLNANGEFEVLSSQVALRPGRKGGARVEMQNVDGFVVCHAYGHGGAGYQNSIGSAKKVVRLIDEHFGSSREGPKL